MLPTWLRRSLPLLLVLAAGCDAAEPEPNLAPTGVSITPDREQVTFPVGATPPSVEFVVAVRDPDSDPLTIQVEASGGEFIGTGSNVITLSTPTDRPRWRSDGSAFVYTFEVRVSDGTHEVSATTQVESRPGIQTTWIGAREIIPGSGRYVGFCMRLARGDEIDSFRYITRDRTTGDSQGNGGSGGITSSFDAPNYSATFATSTHDDAPRSLSATLSLDGTQFDAVFGLVGGDTRPLLLERTLEWCSYEVVEARIDAL